VVNAAGGLLRGGGPDVDEASQPASRIPVECSQLVWHYIEVFADVDADDVRALFGERHRVRSALTACGAGDEHDPPIQQAHDFSSLFDLCVWLSRRRCAAAILLGDATRTRANHTNILMID
jgi:hypothetical protein